MSKTTPIERAAVAYYGGARLRENAVENNAFRVSDFRFVEDLMSGSVAAVSRPSVVSDYVVLT